MAYLNQQEREQLLNELKDMTFNRARGKLRRLDPKGKLAVFRNVQDVNRWVTRYDLHGLGTQVTLVETRDNKEKNGLMSPAFHMTEIIVEPMPGNRT